MNVLLIDDHFCAREGVAVLLKLIFPELTVFESDSFEHGLKIAEDVPLNLVLLDIQLPGISGMIGLVEFKKAFPELYVVMFSGVIDRELMFEALRLGAMGFIPKNLSRQAFIDALRDVLSGKIYLPTSLFGPQLKTSQSDNVELMLHPVSNPVELGLTPREFEVLAWMVQGKCNKDIARLLGIEEQTVRNHLRPIFQKFGVARRTELVVKLFEQGVVFGKPEVGN